MFLFFFAFQPTPNARRIPPQQGAKNAVKCDTSDYQSHKHPGVALAHGSPVGFIRPQAIKNISRFDNPINPKR